jgi:hypothetical protein
MARPSPKDTLTRRAAAALTVIRRQVRNTPEHRLMFAVFDRAVQDAVSSIPAHQSESAAVYLEGDMFHAVACDLDPEWVRKVLRTSGVRLGSYNAERL